ncbi:MAG: alpha/beta hydrolase [Solirubrobacteraceae bacterium]
MARGSCLAIIVAAAIAATASVFAFVFVFAFGSGEARANQLVTITIPDRHGEIPSKWLSYPGPPRADVLLPDGYDPRKRYPLVLNLGGLGGTYATSAFGTGLHIDAIVVTPEPGSGWYTDWWNNGERANPAWESYYLDDVLPTILSRYRILPQRRYHAIVGISMGGLGATYLGGRLPGFFGSVASLSGFLDPQYFAPLTGEGMGLTSLAPLHGDYTPYPVYGPPNGFYANGHNPTDLVMNLAQTRVFESTGTGVPSSAGLKDPIVVPVGSLLESLIIYPMNQVFHRALAAAGVDVTYQVHTGGHDAPDGANELTAMLAWGLFKPVLTHPQSWVNDTVATSGQLWDIGYSFAQPPNEVVQFRRIGSSLAIGAAGSAVAITTSGGCAIHTATPATVQVPQQTCRARSRR